jgi:hypothetical protein
MVQEPQDSVPRLKNIRQITVNDPEIKQMLGDMHFLDAVIDASSPNH